MIGSFTQVGGGGGGGPAANAPRPSWTQGAWYIDPANVSGVASDANSGASAASPVRTWAGGVIAKYGTLEPVLRQRTTWEFMSSAPDGRDPVVLRPTLVLDDSAVATEVIIVRGSLGAAQTVAAGAITVTQADGGANLLTVTLPAGGAYAVNQRVHNTAKGAHAWLKALVSGTTWQLSPPIVVPPTTYANGNAVPSHGAAWATGDAVTVQNLVAVNLAEFSPVLASVLPSLDDCAFITDLRIYNPDTVDGFQQFYPGPLLDLVNLVSDRVVVFPTGISPFTSYYVNCSFPSGLGGGEHAAPDASTGPIMAGGMVGVGASVLGFMRLAGVTLDLGIILSQTYDGFLPPSIEGGYLGEVYLDTATTLAVLGNVHVDGGAPGVFGGAAKVRGPGGIDVQETARLTYNGTAAAVFTQAGGLKANGQATAYALGAGAAAAWNGGIALTPANLDAAFGVAGFGGRALQPGGACIAKQV